MRAMLIASLVSAVAALGSPALTQTVMCTKQTDDPYDLIAHPPTLTPEAGRR